MTSLDLRFIAAFAVVAGLTLVLVACGNKFDMPETESAAIAYVKSKVLAQYHQHPEYFTVGGVPWDVNCPGYLNSLTWSADEDKVGRGGWRVTGQGSKIRPFVGSHVNFSIHYDGLLTYSSWTGNPESCGGYWDDLRYPRGGHPDDAQNRRKN